LRILAAYFADYDYALARAGLSGLFFHELNGLWESTIIQTLGEPWCLNRSPGTLQRGGGSSSLSTSCSARRRTAHRSGTSSSRTRWASPSGSYPPAWLTTCWKPPRGSAG
jgi:hypothetical protein